MSLIKNKKILATLLIAITLILLFLNLGKFLVITETPKKSDVIVVLAGGDGSRTAYGAKLFKNGYAEKIIFSGGTLYHKYTAAELMKEHAIELGIPENKIISETKAESTYTNAIYIKDLLEKNHYNSAIIVSSNYHMRRVRYIFEKTFENSSIKLTYCKANDPEFNPEKWYKTNDSILLLINEYIKYIGYKLHLAE